jgi:predicted RNA methylase
MKKATNTVYSEVKNRAGRILFLVTLGFILMSLNPVKASEGVSGQQATLTGKITDAFTGKPVVGVTITVKGSKTVAKSDKDGNYSIVLPKNAKTLVFTLTGYQPLEVAINGRKTIVVEMSVVEIDPSLW